MGGSLAGQPTESVPTGFGNPGDSGTPSMGLPRKHPVEPLVGVPIGTHDVCSVGATRGDLACAKGIDRQKGTYLTSCPHCYECSAGGLHMGTIRRRFRRSRFSAIGLLLSSTLIVTVLGTTTAKPVSATDSEVLILDSTVTGGSSSLEAQEVITDGLTPVIIDGATWDSMTTAQFASYRAIILGDPDCVVGTTPVAAAEANASTWSAAINGNAVVIGTDPEYHSYEGIAGATLLAQRGVDFAVAQSGKTGAYLDLSCYYHGTSPNTPVPLLNSIAGGGFTVTGVGCYNDAHIVAVSPALNGLTDADLSNWSCSVHEAFQSWPGSFVPLAIARDFDSSFTASDGSQGPPYILASGNIQSFPLSLSPLTDSQPAGTAHVVVATLLDGSTRLPVVGAKIGFRIISGPNAGILGICDRDCTTDSSGQVGWGYVSNGVLGVDTIQAFYDINENGVPDLGEPQTTAGMTWTMPINRYVALGDSVPYGHGLANPYPTPQVGLPSSSTSQGPSTSAYPQLVANDLGLTMNTRSSNCTLTGDQLAISGANASKNNVRPGNSQCSQWSNSESVETDEIPAALLDRSRAKLVTIQAGADDIDFGGCLEYEITKYGPFHLGTSCVSGSNVSSKVAQEIGNVRGALASEIETVAKGADQVLVLNYYQIIPNRSDFDRSSIFPNGKVDPFCWGLSHNLDGARQDAQIIQAALNGAISQAVSDANTAGYANAKLVDISSLETHHETCTGNPALFSGEQMAKSTFYSNIASGNSSNIHLNVWRAGHPNSYGQRDIANAVVSASS